MIRLRNIAVAAFFACLGGSASAAPNVITQPDWLRKPTGEDLAEHYPALASRLGISGYALLSCSINTAGLLVDCRTVSEQPRDLGFGRAALEVSETFRMRPMTLNGKPVDGGIVRIPLRFKLPAEERAAAPPPVSPEAERQAYRLADSMGLVEFALAGWEQIATEVEALNDDATAPAARAAAADGLRRASAAHRDELRTAYARALATVFSDGEMAAMADFAAGPGAMLKTNDALQKAQMAINAEYVRESSAASHAAFCATHACGSVADIQRVWRAADPRETGRIDNPQWAVQPNEATVAATRPPVAELLGVTGLVRLTCKVEEAGGLERCQVDEETPADLGYGDAALALAGGYRLSVLQLADGGAGKKVTVRIGFPAPLQRPPFTAPAGPASARALAKQVAGGEQAVTLARRDTELRLANYVTRRPSGADKKVYEAALDAYRAGSDAALAHYVEQSINIWSTTFTEPQLAAIAAFRASPAGKAQEERREEVEIAMRNALDFVADKITGDARAAFCKGRDCGAQPSPTEPSASQSTGESSEPSARKP